VSLCICVDLLVVPVGETSRVRGSALTRSTGLTCGDSDDWTAHLTRAIGVVWGSPIAQLAFVLVPLTLLASRLLARLRTRAVAPRALAEV